MKHSPILRLARNFVLLAGVFFFFNSMNSQDEFSKIRAEFVSNVSAFRLRPLWLGYRDNLQLVRGTDTLQKELAFFSSIQKKLAGINGSALTGIQQQDYQIMLFQVKQNMERLRLELQWNANKPDSIGNGGLYSLPNGKELYAYYLKKWLGDEVTPPQLFDFGLLQVKRAQENIERIRGQLNLNEDEFYSFLNSPQFYVRDEAAITDSFAQTKKLVQQNMHKLFNEYKIPDVAIRRGRAVGLVQTPGYYNIDTFYFNLFDKPYCTRQFGWLFIHEAAATKTGSRFDIKKYHDVLLKSAGLPFFLIEKEVNKLQ